MKTAATAKPITEEEANRLLSDPVLIDHCRRTGVDLGMIVNNLMADVPTRFKRHAAALRGVLSIRREERQISNE